MSAVNEGSEGETVSVKSTRSGVGRGFVRTPFSVRRNVVTVWRPLPARLWLELNTPADRQLSIRRERSAAIGIAFLVLLLIAGMGSVGYCAGDVGRCFPVIGKSLADGQRSLPTGTGWYYARGQSLVLILWVVVPPLLGWVIVRGIWIPWVVHRHRTGQAAIVLARHLLSVYLFVYLMIVAGAAIMPILILLAPARTELFRWCLWCFLFGESFFVPAVMWGRFIIADRDGLVFGRYRYAGLALYVLLFVVIPILGMVKQLD